MMMMKKMEVVSASLLLLLLLLPLTVVVVSGFLQPQPQHQQSLHHHNMVSSKDAYDSVQAYNRDSFKSGLKTFLGVPNSAQQQATTESSSSLDRMTQSVSNFEPTTVVGGSTNQVVAATASNKVSAAAAAAASSPVVTETTTTSSTSATASAATDAALDRLQEAENAISTIREMATSSSGSSIVGGSGTKHIDPVVDKTFAELYEKFSHPDQFLDPLHNIGAPPGQGLATPLVDYVTKSLQELQAKQMSYYYRPEVGTPDVRKLSSGLEVKTSLLNEIDALQQTSRALSEKLSAEIVSNRHYLAENFRMTMENSALSNDQIKDRLFQNFEAIQATNAKLVERIGSSSSSSFEGSAAWASSIHFPTEQFAAVKSNVIHVLQTPGWTVSDLSDALNVKELGAYYTGAVASLLLLVALNEQLSTDSTTMKTATTTTTTVATSSEPVVPPATKTATPPPPPSSSLSAQTKSDAAEKARLEGMVLELTSAVAILTDELKGLKAGKYETDYQLASMKSEVRTVQNEVGRSVAGGPDTMSKLGQSTLKMQELQAQLEAARLEVDTLKEVNDALTESISAIASTSGSEPHPPSSPPPKTLEESSVFFASIVEDELKEVASVAANKKKEVAPNVAAATADEWGNLSLAALKKKPLTEIVDYLQGKGASVTDENGNLLKKSELVQTVLAYA